MIEPLKRVKSRGRDKKKEGGGEFDIEPWTAAFADKWNDN